jgi:hypothetical protein
MIKVDNIGSKYKYYNDEELVGRVRANFKKNNFFIFDSGVNPKDFKSGEKSNPNEWPRR